MTDENKQQFVTRLQVVHLVGGQSLIGSVEQPLVNGMPHPTVAGMKMPYELFVLPPEKEDKPKVTMVKLGSMLGMMPQLALDYADLTGKILGMRNVDAQTKDHYHKALEQERNPVTAADVASMIKPGPGPEAS